MSKINLRDISIPKDLLIEILYFLPFEEVIKKFKIDNNVVDLIAKKQIEIIDDGYSICRKIGEIKHSINGQYSYISPDEKRIHNFGILHNKHNDRATLIKYYGTEIVYFYHEYGILKKKYTFNPTKGANKPKYYKFGIRHDYNEGFVYGIEYDSKNLTIRKKYDVLKQFFNKHYERETDIFRDLSLITGVNVSNDYINKINIIINHVKNIYDLSKSLNYIPNMVKYVYYERIISVCDDNVRLRLNNGGLYSVYGQNFMISTERMILSGCAQIGNEFILFNSDGKYIGKYMRSEF